MARGRKKSDSSLEDEKHPLSVESEESEMEVESDVVAPLEEIHEGPAIDEPKKISGSPLGKVRGKDLKNY